MKKTTFLSCVTVLSLSLACGLSGCGSQPQQQDAAAQTADDADADPKKAEAPTDIFFYTHRHRADKYVPTEARMGFGSTIEAIGEAEFKDNTALQEVWFSPKINHISPAAFQGCSSLEKAHFQGKIAVINDNAFEGCLSLRHLNADVYTIGLDAFRGCTSLETARFGESIWWIREGAFAGCRKLRSVLMGITMQKLEDGAFEGCSAIEEFSVPNDFKNRLFGLIPSADKWRKVYLLSTEYYVMPKNCTPNSQCTLYVPDAFLDKFRADKEWQQFAAIEPLSKTKYFTAEGFWK